ncbi:hypothetical protein Cob_v006408 [Colletotrichum orbiculare MAFF 240422]|uniref:Uncharacterized protein n=1 Tax=Colletotrichum orbiculare (strain 104-T / ATCC 96160 / CBS 514.97 / LARS 414 / MAFF 240422) TaxID=1213857 RepID=A0A484FPQ1_COLOR|nr:hypothetical protein Cob_v006408 [Colletotrichum orbiculare MAFF 240422]
MQGDRTRRRDGYLKCESHHEVSCRPTQRESLEGRIQAFRASGDSRARVVVEVGPGHGSIGESGGNATSTLGGTMSCRVFAGSRFATVKRQDGWLVAGTGLDPGLTSNAGS